MNARQAIAWLRRTQTVILPLQTLFILGGTFIVLSLFEHLTFRPGAIPAITLVMSAIGLGIDLHDYPLPRFFIRAAGWSVVLSVVAEGAISMTANAAPGHPVFNDWLFGFEIFAPSAFVASFAARWCIRREIKKNFEHGTARFDPEDVKRRHELIEEFKRNNKM